MTPALGVLLDELGVEAAELLQQDLQLLSGWQDGHPGGRGADWHQGWGGMTPPQHLPGPSTPISAPPPPPNKPLTTLHPTHWAPKSPPSPRTPPRPCTHLPCHPPSGDRGLRVEIQPHGGTPTLPPPATPHLQPRPHPCPPEHPPKVEGAFPLPEPAARHHADARLLQQLHAEEHVGGLTLRLRDGAGLSTTRCRGPRTHGWGRVQPHVSQGASITAWDSSCPAPCWSKLIPPSPKAPGTHPAQPHSPQD